MRKNRLPPAYWVVIVCSFLALIVESKAQQNQSSKTFRFTLAPDVRAEIDLSVIPDAVCELRSKGPNNISTMNLVSDSQGILSFTLTAPASAQKPSISTIDCEGLKVTASYGLELYVGRTPSTDRPAPKRLASRVNHIRPALSSEKADSMANSELQRLGYGPRPDAASNPEAYKKWRAWVTRPVKVIQPDLVTLRNVGHRLPHIEGNSKCGVMACPITADNWSGFELANLPPTSQGPYYAVSGRWRIPVLEFTPGFEVHQEFYSSTWVGLDGDTRLGLQDLAQGGTAQDIGYIFFDGHPSKPLEWAYAWTELLPNQKTENVLASFHVHPREDIEVFASIGKDNSGVPSVFILTINDYTSNQTVTVNTPLGGTAVTGKTAEWIMERPTAIPSNQLLLLPKFQPFNIDGAVATWGPGPNNSPVKVEFNKAPGFNVTMVNGAKTLATVKDLGGNSMQFTWAASQ